MSVDLSCRTATQTALRCSLVILKKRIPSNQGAAKRNTVLEPCCLSAPPLHLGYSSLSPPSADGFRVGMEV